jgi:hypothetical protein
MHVRVQKKRVAVSDMPEMQLLSCNITQGSCEANVQLVEGSGRAEVRLIAKFQPGQSFKVRLRPIDLEQGDDLELLVGTMRFDTDCIACSATGTEVLPPLGRIIAIMLVVMCEMGYDEAASEMASAVLKLLSR